MAKRKTKYPIVTDGEWIQPKRKGYILECCDCGLVHRINFRLVKKELAGNVIQFQAFRQGKP